MNMKDRFERVRRIGHDYMMKGLDYQKKISKRMKERAEKKYCDCG